MDTFKKLYIKFNYFQIILLKYYIIINYYFNYKK